MFCGCTATQPAFAPATGDTVTVFVHGYKGSFLDTPEAPPRRGWLSIGELLTSGDGSLALPWEGQPAPTFPQLVASGPLTKFTAIPVLISRDIYLSWMEWGAAHL